MSDFLECECPHCGQNIEYPAEGTGQAVPCPTCGKPVTLAPANQPQANDETRSDKTLSQEVTIQKAETVEQKPLPEKSGAESKWSDLFRERNRRQEVTIQEAVKLQNVSLRENISLPTDPPPVLEQKEIKTRFGNLTEVTIRKTTTTGETPLHRAAKIGRICDIPKHLLTTELFMARKNSFARETPLHVAARYGQLDKVPKEFLTKETLTASTEYVKKESKTGPTPPRTMTPLHTAALYGHGDQIPKEFLAPEFLCIEATGYRQTVLHYFAMSKSLDLIPQIYANSEMWNLKDSNGQTPRSILEGLIEREAYVARMRNESATEKQKEKLRYFGYAFDETITKGQASDALDKCVKDYPEKNQAYYNRPATEDQLAILRAYYGKNLDEVDGPLIYGKVKDLIWEIKMKERREEELKELTYWESEDGNIDRAWARIDAFRAVKRQQLAKAWSIVKSRMTDKSQEPDLDEVEDTMEELFPDFRKKAQDRVTYQCKDCGGIFKARLPSISARNRSSPIYFTEADEIQITIPCPSCGRDKRVLSLKVCKYICPNCSKECLVLKSQTGQSVTHSGAGGCRKDFFAAPSEPSIVEPRIRVMQYVEQSLEQSGDAPTEEQLQKIEEMELKLDRKAGITASKLDELLKLEGQPPRAEDMQLFGLHGIKFYTGDAFSAYALGDLVRCFENMVVESGGYTEISMACVATQDDPALKKATITLDQSGQLVFTWPKRKLEQWYRKGAKY